MAFHHPHTWQVFLAKSSNMAVYGEITTQCRRKSFQLGLNKSGSFSFEVPFASNFTEYLAPKKYCVIVRKDKEIVWSGPIWTKTTDFAAKKHSISCVGWFEMLQTRMLIDGPKTYKDKNDGQIAHALLAIANAQKIGNATISTWITKGTNTSTTKRSPADIEYEQYKSIGQAIQELSDMEAGFDFEVDPETRALNIRGWDKYVDRPNVIFGYRWGPHNLNNVIISEDGAESRNQYFVVGKHDTAEAHDSTAQNFQDYGLHQEVINISDLGDLQIQAVIANTETIVHQTPIVSFQIETKGEGALTVPKLFTDYELGDKVYVTAKDPDTSEEFSSQAVRIFGVNFDIDELGNEKVSSIQTTYNSSN